MSNVLDIVGSLPDTTGDARIVHGAPGSGVGHSDQRGGRLTLFRDTFRVEDPESQGVTDVRAQHSWQSYTSVDAGTWKAAAFGPDDLILLSDDPDWPDWGHRHAA